MSMGRRSADDAEDGMALPIMGGLGLASGVRLRAPDQGAPDVKTPVHRGPCALTPHTGRAPGCDSRRGKR